MPASPKRYHDLPAFGTFPPVCFLPRRRPGYFLATKDVKMNARRQRINHASPLIAIAAIMGFFPSPAPAGPDKIYVLLGSNHLNMQPGYQPFIETNPGLLALYEQDSFDLVLGAYQNSFGKISASVAAQKTLIKGKYTQLSAFAGVAIYPGNGENFAIHAGDLVPMIGLTVEVGPAFATILPGDGTSHAAVIAYGFKVDF